MTWAGTTIRVGPGAQAFRANGHFFDGQTARAEAVRLTIDEVTERLIITRPDGTEVRWPLSLIRRVGDQARNDILVFRSRDNPAARLMMDEPSLIPRCPNLGKRSRGISRMRIAKWGAAAMGSVALIVLVLVPIMADQLARFIPPEGERALGEATLGQIRSALDESGLGEVPFCEASEGLAAVEKMRRRLQAATDTEVTLSIHVLDHDMVNAFALPGGYVVFFRGLIEAADTPEEMASVMAHEIGHVVSRDPTRHALRSAGSIGVLGLVFGDFAGGALVLFLAERLIQAEYSREAEAAADVFAHGVMERAGIPPSSMGTFFQKLLDRYGDAEGIMAHFLSHPQLADRIVAAAEAAPDVELTDPILTDAEWQSVKRMCR
ncbi:M48 family metallopeptidase [Mesobacterium pallidum]|uniref:M48 family metallopeptidase n=1 Tax=Mesobacterium pallidum TaxID=2872037 RepID=UPI001EE3302C|nr:M48 family metallopeptidase [Mesobacterium pallidum]